MDTVHRLSTGTETHEGTDNVYVLPEGGVVVDPGPPVGDVPSVFSDVLADAGLALADVDHVVVTHWHVDHAGNACRLADVADATVYLHEADAPLVGDYAAARGRRVERDFETLGRWGVPDGTREQVRERDTPSPFPDTHDVVALADGDTVAGLEVLHTPGHTEGHAALAHDGTVLLGDLLLPTYTPNVGGSDTRATDPLSTYLESVARVEARFDRGEPGHGTTIEVGPAADAVRAHHRERSRSVIAALREEGAATPWTVARRLFGEMAGVHAKFGAGEATAHLRRLAALGHVQQVADDPLRFRATVERLPEGFALTP